MFSEDTYCLISAVGPKYFLDIENSKTIPPEILKILETDQSRTEDFRISRISGGIVF